MKASIDTHHPLASLHQATMLCSSHQETFHDLFRAVPWIQEMATDSSKFQVMVGGDASWSQDSQVHECIFINGKYDEARSHIPEVVTVLSLSEAQTLFPHLLREYRVDQHPLAFLNATGAEGVVIYIPEDTHIDTPLYMRYISAPMPEGESRYICSPKVVLVLGARAHAHICIEYVGNSGGIVNGVTDVCVLKHAELLISMNPQSAPHEYFSWTHSVKVEEHASCVLVQTVGKQFSGHGWFENDFSLVGENARIEALASIFSPTHVWLKNKVLHDAEQTYSQQTVKSIIHSGSFSFEGEIHITPQGQLSKAYQKHDTLLFEDAGKVTTFPRLTILADDVKASHGASVGTLNPEHLFYLRSRGMSCEEARDKLTQGFLTHMLAQDILPTLSPGQRVFGENICS